VRPFLQALSFLTILPLGPQGSSEARALARSMAYYPFAGLFIGLFAVIGYSLFSLLFPRSFSLWLTIGASALLTGGLHLDGFADTMDGLGCRGTREKVLDVMRDSRIGAFGVIGLVFLIGAKYLALDQIPDPSLSRSLIVMAVMGRSAMVLVCYRSPYARAGQGLAKPFTENLGIYEALFSAFSALAIAVALMGVKGAMVFLGIGLFSLGYRLFFKRKLGGITGDVLGAANELTELLCLVLLVLLKKI
jgi:adenosylcobinamide-GDP ribazoletransferase